MPARLTAEQNDAVIEEASTSTIKLTGVAAFQWLRTVTVEFQAKENYELTMTIARWQSWLSWVPWTFEASSSVYDGYEHPAIIAEDKAYYGFFLEAG